MSKEFLRSIKPKTYLDYEGVEHLITRIEIVRLSDGDYIIDFYGEDSGGEYSISSDHVSSMYEVMNSVEELGRKDSITEES
tara:strand:+ start:623 stop:865 length:243 start_codon:yes stop_codon:yes gene_type:complete